MAVAWNSTKADTYAPDQCSSGKYNIKHIQWKLCHHLQRSVRSNCLDIPPDCQPTSSITDFLGDEVIPILWAIKTIFIHIWQQVTSDNLILPFLTVEDYLQHLYRTRLNQPLLQRGENILALANNSFHPTNTSGKKSHSTDSIQLTAQKCRPLCSHKHMQSTHTSQHTCFQGEKTADRLLHCSAWLEVGSFQFRLTQAIGSWKIDTFSQVLINLRTAKLGKWA